MTKNTRWRQMYCPLCGSELEMYDLPPCPEIDWSVDHSDEEMERLLKRQVEYPERLECICTKGCFQKDFPLYFHHPYGGPDSAPGDSWSLSWVK